LPPAAPGDKENITHTHTHTQIQMPLLSVCKSTAGAIWPCGTSRCYSRALAHRGIEQSDVVRTRKRRWPPGAEAPSGHHRE
ncbi:hypothetical protein, partial [Nocardioides sp. GY 10113]|uniref:hypothetical protein n=1 Tax=Nocardioides sp. GY 10113 TaxID=2569761 RepID=UPI00197EC9CD